MTTPALTVPPVRSRAAIVRQGRVLNGISLAYNLVEAGTAIMAGMASGSIALVGFGVDASLELLASLSATWRLSVDGSETHAATGSDNTVQEFGTMYGYWNASHVWVNAGAADDASATSGLTASTQFSLSLNMTNAAVRPSPSLAIASHTNSQPTR
jgi:hypothetical protein